MSQFNLQAIIRQQQEQLAAMQAQIQALLERGAEERGAEEGAVARSRGGATEVAKPQIFDGMSSKVAGFIIAYKLYIRMKLREKSVEEQV